MHLWSVHTTVLASRDQRSSLETVSIWLWPRSPRIIHVCVLWCLSSVLGLGCGLVISVAEWVRGPGNLKLQWESRNSDSYPIRQGSGKHSKCVASISTAHCSTSRPPVLGVIPSCESETDVRDTKLLVRSDLLTWQHSLCCHDGLCRHCGGWDAAVRGALSNSVKNSWITKSTVVEIWVVFWGLDKSEGEKCRCIERLTGTLLCLLLKIRDFIWQKPI